MRSKRMLAAVLPVILVAGAFLVLNTWGPDTRPDPLEEPSLEELIRGGAMRADEPLNLIAETDGSGAHLAWTGPGEAAVVFRIYRRSAQTGAWTRIGSVEASNRGIGEFTFHDDRTLHNIPYVYGVTSENRYAQESKTVETAPVVVP